MRLLFLLLAAIVFPAAATAQPAPADSPERPLLVANADGSWTITSAIHEAPVSLAYATDGLLLDAEAGEALEWEGERDRMREAEDDDQVERAFEEAVDAVQSQDPRR